MRVTISVCPASDARERLRRLAGLLLGSRKDDGTAEEQRCHQESPEDDSSDVNSA